MYKTQASGIKAKITGTGSAFPPQIIDNDTAYKQAKELEPEAWDQAVCEEVTQVITRRWAADSKTGKIIDGCTGTEMAVKAARNAMDMANIRISDVDLIIHTTATPDYIVDPDPSVEVHYLLGADINCAAYTLQITCVGICNAAIMARSYILSGMARNVLITASTTFSPYKNKPWLMTFFVGDGASAMVISASEENDGSEIIAGHWGSRRGELGVYYHVPTVLDHDSDHYIDFNLENITVEGPELFTNALNSIKENHPEYMKQLDHVILHQANIHLQKVASEHLDFSPEKIPFNLPEYGNTLNPSTGLVLDWQVREGNIKRGDLVAVFSVGTGWQWSSYLMRY